MIIIDKDYKNYTIIEDDDYINGKLNYNLILIRKTCNIDWIKEVKEIYVIDNKEYVNHTIKIDSIYADEFIHIKFHSIQCVIIDRLKTLEIKRIINIKEILK